MSACRKVPASVLGYDRMRGSDAFRSALAEFMARKILVSPDSRSRGRRASFQIGPNFSPHFQPARPSGNAARRWDGRVAGPGTAPREHAPAPWRAR
jgi:hypothetical protein